ncbi:hypothetical protein D1007_32001 [Hordeum vulgare]|nr:hypothetical protein D1007_32001 [Hordeum vulgare]
MARNGAARGCFVPPTGGSGEDKRTRSVPLRAVRFTFICGPNLGPDESKADRKWTKVRLRSRVGRLMDKIVNIHYVDKEAFMNVDIVDKYEEVLIFLESPTYEEVVEETRIRLNVPPIVEHKVEVEANEYPQYEFRGSAPIKDDGHDSDEEYERHHNIVGDVEAQVRHDDMDPDIVYQRACVDDSDDEGPVNELDEDG